MKKILGIFLLLQVLWIPNVYAKELPTISVGSFDAYVGERLVVPITIENNPGCTYLGIKFYYDTNSLEYVDSKLKGLDSADMKNIVRSEDMITLYAMIFEENKVLNDNGTIAEITFNVKENAMTSTLRMEVTDFGGADLTNYEYKQQEGVIRVNDKKITNTKENLTDLLPPSTEEGITWKSADERVATIDEQGNITFFGEGSTTITGIDSDGNVVLEKGYAVVGDEGKIQKNDKEEKRKEPKKEDMFLYILTTLAVLLIIACIIIFIRFSHKKKNQKVNAD